MVVQIFWMYIYKKFGNLFIYIIVYKRICLQLLFIKFNKKNKPFIKSYIYALDEDKYNTQDSFSPDNPLNISVIIPQILFIIYPQA